MFRQDTLTEHWTPAQMTVWGALPSRGPSSLRSATRQHPTYLVATPLPISVFPYLCRLLLHFNHSFHFVSCLSKSPILSLSLFALCLLRDVLLPLVVSLRVHAHFNSNIQHTTHSHTHMPITLYYLTNTPRELLLRKCIIVWYWFTRCILHII